MIQVYTGNGKGKTTAALGLALRAAGAGFNVYIGQFAKGRLCSEHKALKKLKNIKVEQFGRGCFVKNAPKQDDIISACQGLKKAKEIISGKKYRLVILDEINIALKLKLVSIKDVLDLIKHTSKDVELVLTGRSAPLEVIRLADLVSEVKEVKHYYSKGIRARRGIEL